MSRGMAIAAVAAVLIATGAVSGMFTNRWGVNLTAKNRMVLPVSVGEWDSREDPVEARVLEISQAETIDRRWYINRNNGTILSVSLIYGSVGPVAVHTPDICYRGSGFEESAPGSIREIEAGKPDRFMVRRFQKQGPAPTTLSVHYAWNAGEHWEVHDNPRIAFAGKGSLNKLYVNCDTTAAGGGPEADAVAREFLRVLLPTLKDTSPTTP